MFDVGKTHIRDPKSGRVIETRLYRKIVEKSESHGTIELYEYPRGSGIYYNPDKSLNAERSKEGLVKKVAKEDAEKLAALEAAKSPEEKHQDALKAARELLDKEKSKAKAQEHAHGGKA